MEKIIDTVLERLKETNLHSAVARQTIVRAIMKEIRSGKGFFLNMNSIDDDIPEPKPVTDQYIRLQKKDRRR